MPVKVEGRDSRSPSVSSTCSTTTLMATTVPNEDPASIPWPGNTYTISQSHSCGILRVENNKLLVGGQGQTTNAHWRIEEDPVSGLFTLQNEGTGLYLCINSVRTMVMMNARHPNEGFIPMQHVEGGYVLKWWDSDRWQMRAIYEGQEMVRLRFIKVCT